MIIFKSETTFCCRQLQQATINGDFKLRFLAPITAQQLFKDLIMPHKKGIGYDIIKYCPFCGRPIIGKE